MIATVVSLICVAILIGALIWTLCGPAGPPPRDLLSRRVEWPDDL